MGLFTPITEALAAAGKPSLFAMVNQLFTDDHGIQADRLTNQWLAAEIAGRIDLSVEDAARLVVGVSVGGGPDLRTIKGMACASIILGIPGDPITPTQH